MELTSIVTVKKLLERYEIRPFKGLGQNFLINEGILKKIIEAADIKPEDIILEVGPGIGTLTQELAKKAEKVIAIEKDKKMVEILKETLADFTNIKVINADILKTDLTNYKLKTKNYKLISNLPYNIASAVIRKFLESENHPQEMILMVQKEVAQRICAKAPDMTHSPSSGSSRAGLGMTHLTGLRSSRAGRGMTRSTGSGPSRAGRGMNLLAVSVQFYSEPKILFYVSKNNFWPKPKVDGAVIRISKIKYQISKINTDLFFKIVRAGFSQPRKQILNNLSKVLKLNKQAVGEWLLKNNIGINQRAETLKIKDWIKLTKNYIITK